MIRWLRSLFGNSDDQEKVSVRHRSGVECDGIGPGWNTVKVQLEVGGEVRIYAGNKPFTTSPPNKERPGFEGQRIPR